MIIIATTRAAPIKEVTLTFESGLTPILLTFNFITVDMFLKYALRA
jgi:hypothetical protein